MTEDPTYFIRGDDGAEYGPVALDELREWVGENRAGLGTEVRLDAPDSRWHAWHFYPELVALLAEVRVSGVPSASVPVLAPMGRRSAAFLLDLVMSFILVVILWLMIYWLLPPALIARLILYTQAVLQGLTPAAPTLPSWFEVAANVIFLVVPTLYYTGFHTAHGRTPAKSIFHLQVTDAEGRKPTLGKALIRALIFVLSVYFFYGIPLLYAFFNPQRRTLHDLAAGTYVVES